jgi:hypothetical protein
MSRSGYTDDYDNYWAMIRWLGAVKSAIRGKRGQKLLRDLRDALDAMPVKALIAEELVTERGEVCALGCLAQARRMDVSGVDPEDSDQVAKLFDISPALASEIAYENDEGFYDENPERRWEWMRKWVGSQITEVPS